MDLTLTENIVALLKGFVVIENNGEDNTTHASTLQCHLMQLGYVLDETAFEQVKRGSLEDIVKLHDEVISFILEHIGGKYDYRPLYSNFPDEVMDLTDCELYYNAVMHYLSLGEWEPCVHHYEKPIEFEKVKYNIITAGGVETFRNIFKDLVSINQSLTSLDTAIVRWCVDNGHISLPDTIPFKETLCLLAGTRMEGLPIKTVTDVLRIAMSMSGGDPSLPKIPPATFNGYPFHLSNGNPARTKFRFKSFSRAERRYLLDLMEISNSDVKEMKLRKQQWVRLAERLHPSDFVKTHPRSVAAFTELRDKKVTSWYSDLDREFDKSFGDGLKFLSQRPGEFARRLDALLRNNHDRIDDILTEFERVADRISNKVLFELLKHFADRTQQYSRRVSIKGRRVPVTLNTLPAMSMEITKAVEDTIKRVLMVKFADLPNLDSCRIDERLRGLPLPTNMRTMNFSLKPKVRGQRIPIEMENPTVIRPFVHWMDKDGLEDLDLSAVFVGTDKVNYVNFNNLRTSYAIHSGDVRLRRGPCAEYIDVDIKKCRENGYRYVMFDVRNYRGNSLESVDCCFGMMEREYPSANCNWLPETTTHTQSLYSPATNTLITIVDLLTMEYIMVDEDTNGAVYVNADMDSVLRTIKHYSEPPKFSVYDLIELHVKARGTMVDGLEDVETEFAFEEFANDYTETLKLMGN